MLAWQRSSWHCCLLANGSKPRLQHIQGTCNHWQHISQPAIGPQTLPQARRHPLVRPQGRQPPAMVLDATTKDRLRQQVRGRPQASRMQHWQRPACCCCQWPAP